MSSPADTSVAAFNSMPSTEADARASLASHFRRIREATEKLAEPLSPEDCILQTMDDVSPTKWHLAHTSWFFETFVLEAAAPGYKPFHPDFRILYNSYYNAVGEQYPRPRRGLLSRPSLSEILAYRTHVDEQVLDLLQGKHGVPVKMQKIIEVGLNHEQQHQELILTDIKHVLSCNPLHPVYKECRTVPAGDPGALTWHAFEESIRWLGHPGHGFAFDNERPRHRVFLHDFEIASRLVTNREFLSFIDDGGYEKPELWLSDGWATKEKRSWMAPLYWKRKDGRWMIKTLSGLEKVRMEEPVCHVSHYEADAYARWAGVRLPAEAEWETAAGELGIEGNFVEEGYLRPVPLRTASDRPSQMYGDVWEWTQSPYGPYPGYSIPPGAIGEYNGKFMSNQMVLRGGSCATPRSHIRPTYRNFFPPDARWQFSGFRLARDAV